MKRRDFLVTTASATSFAVGMDAKQGRAQTASQTSQYYEWRTYRVESHDQRQRVEAYLQYAALPAWNRLGVGPVGIWTESGDEASPSLHALLTFASIEQFSRERTSLEADTEYRDVASEYLATPKGSPAFSRIESSLMVAFDGMRQLAVPRDKPQLYELRIYESYSEAKARRKIEMFNEGEVPIFIDAGFQPVFFGETLIGPLVPNLKYMLASDDEDAHERAWKGFVSHPDWLAMKDLPRYADTVSRIISIKLRPAAYSQI